MPFRGACWRVFCCLVFWLLPLGTFAKGKDTAQSHIEAARSHYENLEYESALEELDRAHRRASSQEETLSILLYEGIIMGEMGREEEAIAAFHAALRLDPKAKLPLKVSPKIAQRFDTARKDLEQDTTVVATPPAPPPPAPVAPPPSSKVEPTPPATAQPAPTPSPVEAPIAAHVETSTSRALSPRVLAPAITGGALVLAGGVFWGMARSQYSQLQSDGSNLNTYADVKHSASRGRAFQTVGFSLMGAGLVGLGVATGLYVMDKPGTQVALGVGTDGTSAFIHGRWP